MNGGNDLSDLEIARLQLQETQLKLSGRYIPPSERTGVISRQEAEDALRQTLANGIPEKEAPVDETDASEVRATGGRPAPEDHRAREAGALGRGRLLGGDRRPWTLWFDLGYGGGGRSSRG